MAKECGKSESFKSFDEQIGSVMDSIGVNKIAGTGGVADNISGLKAVSYTHLTLPTILLV